MIVFGQSKTELSYVQEKFHRMNRIWGIYSIKGKHRAMREYGLPNDPVLSNKLSYAHMFVCLPI